MAEIYKDEDPEALTASDSASGTGAKPSRATTYGTFALVTLAAALGNMSQTGLNAMLPQVMGDLSIDVTLGQWLTTGYMLILGIAVPLSTYLIRRLSLKSYIILCFSLFALGSLMDWVAPVFPLMLLGRILQSVSVGIAIPLMQDVAMTGFPPGQQATAMGVAGIALGFAPNIGPAIGGAMDSAFGWRSFFLMLFGATVLLLLWALLALRKSDPRDPAARFEKVSFLYSTLGFGGVLLGLSQASSFGFASPWFWFPVLIGAVFLGLFVRRQKMLSDPLIDLRIFRSSRFDVGAVAIALLFGSFMGITLVIPLFAQDVLGWSSFDAGMTMFPATIVALVVNPLAGSLADRFGVRPVGIVFGACLALGAVGSIFFNESSSFLEITFWQTLRSVGVSGLIGPLVTYALAGLEGPLIPHGSSATVILRQVVATFGTAIMVCAIALGEVFVGDAVVGPAFPYELALVFSALLSVLCFALILGGVRR